MEPIERFTAVAADPHAVVGLLVEGMVLLETDPAAGEQLIATVLSKQQVDATGTKVADREMIRRLTTRADIARSYVGGAAANDYASSSLTVMFDTDYSKAQQGVDFPEPGAAKLFVVCGGADRPRPVELKKNASGQWKVVNWSSLTVGVQPRTSVAGDF